MPSKIIIDHALKIRELQEDAIQEIDGIIKKIDVRSLINSTEVELSIVTEMIKKAMIKNYIHKAANLGVDFGNKLKDYIKKDKEIIIDSGSIKAKEELFGNVQSISKE